MNRPQTAIIIALGLATVVSLSSCVHLNWFAKRSKPASTNKWLYAVKAEKTSFYKYGPQQPAGPDRELNRDTVMTVIRQSMGYSKVRLEDGQEGFVSSEDISRAPEKLIAHADTATATPDWSNLPPPPPVQLPVADPPDPKFEPTPLPQALMP